jgi:hypothetical protein
MTELAEALLNSKSKPPPGHVALVSHLLIDVLTPGQLAVLPTASARSAARHRAARNRHDVTLRRS